MGRSQEGCAASQSRPWRLRAQRRATRWTQEDAVLQDLEERCAVPAERLRLVADAMVTEMRVGLSAAAEDGSLLKMLVTYVDSLPSGQKGWKGETILFGASLSEFLWDYYGQGTRVNSSNVMHGTGMVLHVPFGFTVMDAKSVRRREESNPEVGWLVQLASRARWSMAKLIRGHRRVRRLSSAGADALRSSKIYTGCGGAAPL
ncbi:hypothetical protein EJB05_01631, partial [Eragrostis curvula]